jgi:parallel beta-helix repeat protein
MTLALTCVAAYGAQVGSFGEPPPLLPSAALHLYVDPAGDDANSGQASTPLRTIQRAADRALPGATVHVAPGNYAENVTTKKHGAAHAPIRYVSDVKWGAKIVGAGTEATWTNGGNHTQIVDFDISGSGRLGILNWASWTLMAGNHVHDLAVSGGCTSNGGAGINNANYNGSDDDVIGNVVHDIGVPGACNGVHGIYSSNARGRIANNIVYRNAAYGIHLWHAADEVLIANNTVFQNGVKGMGGGILLGTGDSPRRLVLNHTRVVNNIVYKNPGWGIVEYCYPGHSCIGASNTIANNLVYGNGTGISLRVGKATGTIVADPQFLNYQADGSGDYRLRHTSPALSRGPAIGAPAPDTAPADN